MSVLMIAAVVGAYIYTHPDIYEATKLMTVRFYDANKNPIQQSGFGQQTIVGSTAKVAYADFTISLQNTGNRVLTCNFKDISPASFSTALNLYAQSNPSRQNIVVDVGQTVSVTSDLVDMLTLEPVTAGVVVPMDFSVTIVCSYPEGALERVGVLTLNLQRDDYANPGLTVNVGSNLQTSSLLKCSQTLNIPGQVLYLPFNNDPTYGESATLTHDFSGNNYNGVVSNAAWNPSGGKFGDGAFLFNGVDSLITIPDNSQLSPSNSGQKYTISFWVKFDTFQFLGGSDTSGYNALHFIGKYSLNDNSGREFYFRIYNSTAVDGVFRGKRMSFYTFSPAGSLGAGSYFQPGISNLNGPAPDFAPNEWVYVTGVINGTHTRIYQNGVLRDMDPLSGYNVTMGDTYAPFFIGRFDSRYKDFQGSIDEVRVFNRALTDSEVSTLYNLNSCTYSG